MSTDIENDNDNENEIVESNNIETNTTANDENEEPLLCCLKEQPEKEFPSARVSPHRARLLRVHHSKWLNGTVLHYYFFDKAETDGVTKDGEFSTYVGTAEEQDVVRRAFDRWAKVGMGLRFQQVFERKDAEIRIAFLKGDGAWSYLGRQVMELPITANDPTMNFGWNIAQSSRRKGLDTALHEIGHALGFPHEHQNPKAGIVWNEEAVYTHLAGAPNYWPRTTTHYNILRKLPRAEIEGSVWDKDSIMHYPFRAGLIAEPEIYATEPLKPAGGLSSLDIAKVTQFYPPLVKPTRPPAPPSGSDPETKAGDGAEPHGAGDGADDGGDEGTGDGQEPPPPEEEEEEELIPLLSGVSVKLTMIPGQQMNFSIRPTKDEVHYIRTFGSSDTYMALFQMLPGKESKLLADDDDSGYEQNASLSVSLVQNGTYILRVRLHYADGNPDDDDDEDAAAGSIMMWTGWAFS